MNNLEEFRDKGYTLVKGALPVEFCNLAEAYFIIREKRAGLYGRKINEMFDDPQSPDQFSLYADEFGESLLLKLRSTVEENTGLSLYPTNSFCRVYRSGAILKEHVDRGACEISASLFLGYNYGDDDFSWPLFIDGESISMSVGDMVIYRGMDLNHWREDLGLRDENFYHIQIFLHYVDSSGPYQDLIFNGRKSVYHLNEITVTEEG